MSERVLGNWYLVELLPDEETTPGGVAVAAEWTRNRTSALVLAAGPGRILDSGRRHEMQADPGDGVAFLPHEFRPLTNDPRDRRGMVRDEALAAVALDDVRAPEWLPANDWVGVVCDPREEYDRRESGVVVCATSLRGGESRDRERGEQLFREAEERGRRRLAEGWPRWEVQERARREAMELPARDREALRARIHAEDDSDVLWEGLEPLSSATPVRTGCVWGLGSGRLLRSGERVLCPTMRRLREALEEGGPVRVRWGDTYDAIDLWSGGRMLRLIRAGDLLGVQE